jgi:hypothetical protein
MMVHAYNASYLRGKYQEDQSPRPARTKLVWPYLKNKVKEKDWEHGSSGRALTS